MVLPFDPEKIKYDPKCYSELADGRQGVLISNLEGYLDPASIDFSRYDIAPGMNEETHHFAYIHPYLYQRDYRDYIVAFPKASFPNLEYCRFRLPKLRKLALMPKGRNKGSKYVFEVLNGEPINPVDVPPEKPDIDGNPSISGFVENILFPDDTFSPPEIDQLMPFVLSTIGAPIFHKENRTGGIGVNPVVESKDTHYIIGSLRCCDDFFGRIARLTSAANFSIGYANKEPKETRIARGLRFTLRPIIIERTFDLKFGKSLGELDSRYPGFSKFFMQNRPIGFYSEQETSFIAPSSDLESSSVNVLLKKTDLPVVIHEDLLKNTIKMPTSLKFCEALRYLRYVIPNFCNSQEEQIFTQKAIAGLEKTKRSLDEYGLGLPIVDINHDGKIASAIQLMKAFARRSERSVVRDEDVNYALKVLASNSEKVVEWHHEHNKAAKREEPDLTKNDRKIRDIVEKYQTGCRIADARDAFMTFGGTEKEFEKSYKTLLERGILSEPQLGFIKLVEGK